MENTNTVINHCSQFIPGIMGWDPQFLKYECAGIDCYGDPY